LIVVYPEQTAQANPSKCWNWFKPEDQQRERGEPAPIAGLVREVVRRHGADPRRIFVAGLSAGAAMALVLGETHPGLFAGVGVHSGLPYGSAHDMPSAPAAVKGGRSGLQGMKTLCAAAPRGKAVQAVPTIVFHGDRDQTVRLSNGAHIVQQACDAHGAQPDSQGLQGRDADGRLSRWPALHARRACRCRRPRLHRELDAARRRARLVGRPRQWLLRRHHRPGRIGRDGALLPRAGWQRARRQRGSTMRGTASPPEPKPALSPSAS
jgi:poly(hydroxyalkanoate) depolymerase family esterase